MYMMLNTYSIDYDFMTCMTRSLLNIQSVWNGCSNEKEIVGVSGRAAPKELFWI